LMEGLDILSFIELDPPAARGSPSDDETLAVAVLGVTPTSPCAHSHAITGARATASPATEGLFRNAFRSIPAPDPQCRFHLSSSTFRLVRLRKFDYRNDTVWF